MDDNSTLIKEQIRYSSHEIRNQLSITDVYCEIVRKHLQKIDVKNESIDKALNCIQKSSRLIENSLLDLKLVTNITPTIVDVNHLILESIELACVYVFDKNIVISSDLCEDVRVEIDEKKLQACIINLIKNAVEAIEFSGKIVVSTLIEGDILKIRVVNDGEMIPAELQKSIFEDGRTTKSKGSGIGLYISRENLRAQGGDLLLVSSSCTETVFEITLKVLHT